MERYVIENDHSKEKKNERINTRRKDLCTNLDSEKICNMNDFSEEANVLA